MKRQRLALAVAFCVVVGLTPAGTGVGFADETVPGAPGNAFVTHAGTVTDSGGVDRVRFDLDPSDFTMSSEVTLSLTFLVTAAEGSDLRTGQVDVVGVAGTPDPVVDPRRQEIAGAEASVAVAQIGAGSYEVVVGARQQTAGAFNLAISLTGDVDGDFVVDEVDLARIGTLAGARWHHSEYVAAADTDRNGVVNNGDLRRASRNLGAATSLRPGDPGDPEDPEDPENPLDTFLDADALRLVSLTTEGFNHWDAPIRYELEGAEFWQDPGEVEIRVNGSLVQSGQVTVEPHAITATNALWGGRNHITLSAYDDVGRHLHHEATVWAGAYSVRVDLRDDQGAPLTEPSTVLLRLTDDHDVSVAATTSDGSAFFANVPFSTVVVHAVSDSGHYGSNGFLGGQQSVVAVPMVLVGPPSDIDNNDFSLGTDGWDIGNAPAWIVPHTEGFPPGLYPPPPGTVSLQSAGVRDREPPNPPAADAGAAGEALLSPLQSGNDLVLMTAGQGERGISRTFATKPGTSNVRIRYRFITSEVPGGWFGSEFNDYFRVSLTSAQTGDSAGEANSMNGLGLGAFDFASGATAWRDATLQVAPDGDTIRVDVAVANVGDGLFDSQVVVAWVEEDRDQVRPALAWNSSQGGMNLTYEIVDGELEQAATIDVSWASGAGHGDRIGSPIFSHEVPAGTPEGSHGPVHVPGNLLETSPAGTTHLLAVASEAAVGPLRDVEVQFGPNANRAVVWDRTIDIVKGGLRAGGQPTGTITSTARDAVAQARAMFNNLTLRNFTIAQNVARERAKYGPNGRRVIDVFVAETQGMTSHDAIIANRATIQQAMVDEINRIGCQNVSRHCADMAVRNVVDVSTRGWTTRSGDLFRDSVRPRVDRLLDERAENHFHIEVI